MNMIPEKVFTDIVNNGIYYYPAKKHYLNHSNYNNLNVVCDRCNRNNLAASIGFQKYNLCLLCVESIINPKNKNQLSTKMEQSVFQTRTNMMQNMTRNIDVDEFSDEHSLMMQGMFFDD